MADLAGAAHVVVGEVDRVQVHLVGHVLVPVQAARGGGLEAGRGRAALRLEYREGGARVARVLQQPLVQRDRVLHGHAGARAQREMHRAQRVAQQHDVLVRPAFVAHDVRLEPQRAIAQQLVGAQVLAEHFGAVAPAVVLAGRVQAGAAPAVRIHLDQKGAQVLAVLVAVGDEDAVLGLAEDQRHGVEALARAVPGELVAAAFEGRTEMLGVLLAHRAVAAVGGDHHVDLAGQSRHVLYALLVADPHAGLAAGLLQHGQHVDAGRAREMVALHLDARALMHDFHVIAALVMRDEPAEELQIGLAQEGQADVREHHAPAIGGALRVLLVDRDLVAGVVLLGKQREIQAGRAGADDGDLHLSALPLVCACAQASW